MSVCTFLRVSNALKRQRTLSLVVKQSVEKSRSLSTLRNPWAIYFYLGWLISAQTMFSWSGTFLLILFTTTIESPGIGSRLSGIPTILPFKIDEQIDISTGVNVFLRSDDEVHDGRTVHDAFVQRYFGPCGHQRFHGMPKAVPEQWRKDRGNNGECWWTFYRRNASCKEMINGDKA